MFTETLLMYEHTQFAISISTSISSTSMSSTSMSRTSIS